MQQHTGSALITGASSGLGVAFAHELATRGHDLILTARSAGPMERLADGLRRRHGIEVAVEALDLSQTGSADVLVARLDARGLAPDVLINNAGFGLGGEFLAHDPDRLRAMLQLDIVSLTELSQRLGQRMQARGRGHILLVGSMASFQPDPLLAAYGASKAYVLSLGEALHVELGPGVGVTVLSPGLMDTGFNAASGFEPTAAMRRTVLSTEDVARIGIDALFAGRSNVIAGRLNRLMALASRLAPRPFLARQLYRMTRSHPG